MPVDWFFEDMPEGLARTPLSAPAEEVPADAMTSAETIKLVRAYYRISDPIIRAQVRKLAKSLADVQ